MSIMWIKLLDAWKEEI